MAITVTGYPLGWLNVLEQNIDIEGATNIKLALVVAAHTPNFNTHDFRDDFTANELASGNGYTTGGVTLTNVTWTHDVGTDQIRLDFDDPSWTFAADKTWRYGIVYVETAGADSTDPLLLNLDWGSSQTVSGVYTITVDPTGIFAIDFGAF